MDWPTNTSCLTKKRNIHKLILKALAVILSIVSLFAIIAITGPAYRLTNIPTEESRIFRGMNGKKLEVYGTKNNNIKVILAIGDSLGGHWCMPSLVISFDNAKVPINLLVTDTSKCWGDKITVNRNSSYNVEIPASIMIYEYNYDERLLLHGMIKGTVRVAEPDGKGNFYNADRDISIPIELKVLSREALNEALNEYRARERDSDLNMIKQELVVFIIGIICLVIVYKKLRA